MSSLRTTGLLASITGLLAVAALAFMSPAQADSIQYQSYQRATQDAACPAQPGETPWQASWGSDPSWHPSWEQWANAGTGGWICARAIVWAHDAQSHEYRVGDIGPGGGLVFLVSNGVHYEMAPRTWFGSPSDPTLPWSGNTTNVLTGTSLAIGAGAANTALMLAQANGTITNRAATASVAYRGGGLSDWFLPSGNELNAMCNYSRAWVGAPSTGACTGAQDPAFATGDFGFSNTNLGRTWSSTDGGSGTGAYRTIFDTGELSTGSKANSLAVRPIRAF